MRGEGYQVVAEAIVELTEECVGAGVPAGVGAGKTAGVGDKRQRKGELDII
jgi:hypothetical protein